MTALTEHVEYESLFKELETASALGGSDLESRIKRLEAEVSCLKKITAAMSRDIAELKKAQ